MAIMENANKWFSGKGIFFIALFSLAVLIADQVKIAAVWGAPNQYFTLFQLIGPIAGGFIGAIAGMVSVLFAELLSFLYLNREPSLLNILRLSPMLFATYYFATFGKKNALKGNLILLFPIAAMLLFITHPVGSQSWYYSLFWVIPVFAALFFRNNLFARSLGASFTAHSIGGVIWLFTVPTTPAFWIALMPIVIIERFAFSLGISGSYIAFNTLLSKLEQYVPSEFVRIDRRYSLIASPSPSKMRK